MAPDAKSFVRRDKLLSIEAKMQQRWEELKLFEIDAPHNRKGEADAAPRKKFFCTSPYPYMNGRMHVGHAFTYAKVFFAQGFHRVKGEDVLYPFAFHCTGMPIQAAANKLRREIVDSFDPQPEEGAADAADVKVELTPSADDKGDAAANLGKFKGKKTKAG